MAKKSSNYTPNVDAGYGLIYRLNDLWNGADRRALAGDLDGWNHVLNAIWRNLLYRHTVEVEYEDEEKTKIKDIKLDEEDSKIYNKFKVLIKDCKIKMNQAVKARNRTAYFQQKENYHEILSMKDIWLRKFMNERGLYLKELEFDPSRAMWGG
jgi:hypothetical protein